MGIDQGTVAAVSRSGTYTFTKPVRDEIVLVAGLGVEGDVHAGVHVRHRGRLRADPAQPNFRQVHLIQRELFDEVGAKGYAVAAGQLGENVTTSGIDLLGLPVGTILRFGPPVTAGGAASQGLGLSGAAGGSPDQGGGSSAAAGGPADRGFALSAVAGGSADRGPGPSAVAGGSADRGLGLSAAAGGSAEVLGTGGGGPLEAVLEAAAGAKLDRPTAASALAIAAAAASDRGDDPRPAVVLAGLRNPCGQINGFAEGLLSEVVGRDAEGKLVRKAGVMAVVLRGGPIRPGDTVTAELPPPPHARLDRV